MSLELEYLICAIICGFVCYAILNSKGYGGYENDEYPNYGFLWGFICFLGIIVCACKTNVKMLKAIQESESKKNTTNDYNGDWTCPVCGERYSKYAKQCICGYVPGDYYDNNKQVETSDGGFWRCPRCGNLYSQYAKKCSCGYVLDDNMVSDTNNDNYNESSTIEDGSDTNSYMEEGTFEETELADVLDKMNIMDSDTVEKPVEEVVNELSSCDNSIQSEEDNNDINGTNSFELEHPVKVANQISNKGSELDNIEMIKKYKELLDLGIINRDEFGKKKKELLKL